MTDPGTALEARLRRAGSAVGAALVADLWAARGFDTARDGDVVVATAGPESVTILIASDAGAARTDRPVDTVVLLDTAPAEPVGERDVRLVDVTDLAGMLLYSIDREAASDLCRRHLGTRLERLSPPRSDRLGDGLRAVATRLAGTPLAVLCLFVLVGAVASAGLLFAPGPATSADPGAVETPAAVPAATATEAPGADAGAATGSALNLSAETEPNLTALGAAHEAALAGRSYTAWVDFYRPLGGIPNATRVQRDVDMAVADGRWLAETTVENDSDRTRVLTLYDDGSDRYLAELVDGNTTYRRLPAAERSPLVVSPPSTLRRTLVSRYLSTPNLTVSERVRTSGRTTYRLDGSGLPSGFRGRGVRNYTVVALVDEGGLVRDLAVEATVGRGPDAYRVRFEVTYDRLGQTTITPPAWYERRFAANGTGSG